VIHGAGDPDDVLVRRIDVVISAVACVEAWGKGDPGVISEAEDKLEVAVRRYKSAVNKRKKVSRS
jgi:hypothetical protein